MKTDFKIDVDPIDTRNAGLNARIRVEHFGDEDTDPQPVALVVQDRSPVKARDWVESVAWLSHDQARAVGEALLEAAR